MYITGRNIIGIYWEISGEEISEAELMFVEWDTRTGKEQVDKVQEGYYIFTGLTNEEIVVMSNSLSEMIKLLEQKKKNIENTGDTLEVYRQQMLNYQQEELEKGGAIYCAGEKIFVENKEGNVMMLW